MNRTHITTRLFVILIALAGALTVAAPRGLQPRLLHEYGSPWLVGAGSTFAHPLMSAWARDYRVFRNSGGVQVVAAGSGLADEIDGAALDDEAIGSQAGIQRVKAHAVDFAVSEMPLPAADLRSNGLLQVPLVAGAVAVAVNIEGQAAAGLRLSPGLLADIFLGRVKTWADPPLPSSTPSSGSPPHRSPWCTALMARAPPTPSPLSSRNPAPTGKVRLAATCSSIGQWERLQGQLRRGRCAPTHPQFDRVSGPGAGARRQAPGSQCTKYQRRFVAPSRASVQAAVAAASWDPATQFNTSLVNMAGEDSYPIGAVVFGLASEAPPNAHRRRVPSSSGRSRAVATQPSNSAMWPCHRR